MTSEADIDRIVRTHQSGLWRYLRLLGCDESLADDLTQETFVIVLRKEFEEHSDAATASYLRTTARFLFLKAVKQRRTRMTAPMEVAELVWQEEVRDDEGEELTAALRECLETLDDRQRELINLRYFKRAGRKDIAKALKLSVIGVKSLLRRVKASLKSCVEARRRQA